DIVSLLWQAKANLPQSQRIEMLDIYHAELQKFYKIDRESFLSNIKEFVLFRTLQVLGAYGFRGFFERKSHFMQSVPFAVDNLRQLLADSDFSRYPYLVDILSQLTKMPRFSQPEKKTELTVAVRSFSYKKGYPEDLSGNGGGFVFDCRALHNPGRYDQYKPFTGMDQCVIDFIEQDGGMQKFLENVYAIVDASVKKYIERGFTSLMVCFGCTGGRHRSVYGAQHLAEHIYEKFNVRVDLEHIEQKVKRTYTPKK
ncbi:MAG: phosphotransferase, partial [Bacteroidales bacterium]|nr:phosphotransferase [Bacteroidales bacterium]